VPAREAESLLRELLRNFAHLAVLSALALAQPVFDILGRNPEFFAVRRSSSAEIVLLTVALVLVPPAALVLVEVLAAALSRPLARALHLVFVAALAGLLALHVVANAETPTGAAALAVALVVGGAAALLYRRTRAVRTFLSVLVPVPLIFAALFLFDSRVSRLVFVETPEVRAATVASRTPVVMIVLDEMSTVAMLDQRERIDARRFPNFAALGRDAIWFRNATTPYWLSEVAVPTILTGRAPSPDKLPVYSEHPRNLFTLLGSRYRMRVVETLTSLCPRSLCRDAQAAQARAVTADSGSLANDLGIVYLHLVLPRPYVERVPPIDDSWGNFGRGEQREPAASRRAGSGFRACGRNVCEFTDLIARDRRPTLYLLHTMLPHVPYVYLPSGRSYAVDHRVLRGMVGGRWRDQWGATQSYQRYLLQVGYTDRALGQIFRKLRATGVYDRALVIVTADHGVTFRVGAPRRLATPQNLDDIAFVPMFVKLPGQRKGRIDDSLATTTDLLPTIARVLGVSIPWRVDGEPLVGRALPSDGTVGVELEGGGRVSARLSELRARRRQALARQIATFGTGSLGRVYRIGPHRSLVGRPVAALRVRERARGRVEITDPALLGSVDPSSGFLPSYVEGNVSGVAGGRPLAIALNGRIAGVTRAFADGLFAVLVPERTLRAGRNAVEVFVVRRGGGGLVLERLRGSELALTLREQGGREVIASATGRMPISARAVVGTVAAKAAGARYAFTGRARNPKGRTAHGRLAHSVIVFVDGQAVYRARHINLRPHHILGQKGRKDSFGFELPSGLFPEPGSGSVRVFATTGRVASELRYGAAYPWPRTP
jgi:hypothetical protein